MLAVDAAELLTADTATLYSSFQLWYDILIDQSTNLAQILCDQQPVFIIDYRTNWLTRKKTSCLPKPKEIVKLANHRLAPFP